MIQQVYQLEDRGCHINIHFLRDYRLNNDIKERFKQLKEFYKADRILFESNIAALSVRLQ